MERIKILVPPSASQKQLMSAIAKRETRQNAGILMNKNVQSQDGSASRYRPLTLLHSNDMHGDFFEEVRDDGAVGGVSLLSGYLKQVRETEPNVLYCIAGDMVQGSLVDTEFKGLSTVDILNMLAPDVCGLGNHETDYGLAHLLFLERCAEFPIVNANIYIARPLRRLFTPHRFIKVGGMRVMFIGIVTAEIVNGIKSDGLISSLIDIRDAADEVGRICNAFRTQDVDLTVVLTHVGFEEDCELAALLDPAWGVDIIIGGHTHTVLDEPAQINDVLVTQAGVGTDQIGRFDLVVDTSTNTVAEYSWELVPINKEHCPRDEALDELLESYSQQTDLKYGGVLCTLPRQLTHPSRYQETELGNVVADLLRQALGVDLVLYGSGAIRKEEFGSVVTLGELLELCPYNAPVMQFVVTGEQLRRMISYVLREDAFMGEHTEFYQYSDGVRIVWSRSRQSFDVFDLHGEPVADATLYKVALQEFHRNNFENCFNVPLDEVLKNAPEVILTTAEQDVLIEYFLGYTPPVYEVEGRLVVVE